MVMMHLSVEQSFDIFNADSNDAPMITYFVGDAANLALI
jgi:hypothetical protein